jgi:hypothetical protein
VEILAACRKNAAKIKKEFESFRPDKKDTRRKLYKRAARKIWKGEDLKKLRDALLVDVGLIVNHKVMMSVTPEQSSELKEMLQELNCSHPQPTAKLSALSSNVESNVQSNVHSSGSNFNGNHIFSGATFGSDTNFGSIQNGKEQPL